MGRLGDWLAQFTASAVMTDAEAAAIKAAAAARGLMVCIDARIVPSLPEPPQPPCCVTELEAGS
jgi:hypothetical protein